MREPGTYQSALLLFAQNATRSACSNYSQKRETEESAAYTRTQCAKLTPLASSFRILYATAETAWSAPTPGTREHCVCKAKPRAAVQLVRRRVESRAAAATRVRTRARHVDCPGARRLNSPAPPRSAGQTEERAGQPQLAGPRGQMLPLRTPHPRFAQDVLVC
ncbi:Collagen Alpha-2(I) Chain [Manis pentadactyla]|nr:Collagen Alpha-2(I) Chain [Manis pentadactyla]